MVDYSGFIYPVIAAGVIAVVIALIQSRHARSDKREILTAIQSLAQAFNVSQSGGADKERRPTSGKGKRTHKREQRGSNETEEFVQVLHLPPAEPRSVLTRFGEHRWAHYLAWILTVVFVAVLVPWFIVWFFTSWYLPTEFDLSAVWYLLPFTQPYISAILDFVSIGFWVLIGVFVSLVLVRYSIRRWRAWSFLHPEEVRLYPDGSILTGSAEVVRPNRVALFFIKHRVSTSIGWIVAATSLYFLIPYSQGVPVVLEEQVSYQILYFPTILSIIMMLWSMLLEFLDRLLMADIRVLEQRRSLVASLVESFRASQAGGRTPPSTPT